MTEPVSTRFQKLRLAWGFSTLISDRKVLLFFYSVPASDTTGQLINKDLTNLGNHDDFLGLPVLRREQLLLPEPLLHRLNLAFSLSFDRRWWR